MALQKSPRRNSLLLSCAVAGCVAVPASDVLSQTLLTESSADTGTIKLSSQASLNTLINPITASSFSLAATSPEAVASPAVTAPITRGPVAGGVTLPKDVASYNVKPLNPNGWAGSDMVSIAGGQSAGFVQDASGTNVHAAFWANTTASIIDLHPNSGAYSLSHVLGVGAQQIVGFATQIAGSANHAMLWTMGQGSNSVDLNPVGFRASYAKAATGTLQAGLGYISLTTGSHALVWQGNSSSFTDINPAGFFSSEALGASGQYEVGDGGFFDTGGAEVHAMLWNGTSNVPTDLHPTNLSLFDSKAVAIAGTAVGGYGTSGGYSHALYWSALSADSAVDLNPRGYLDSQVTAVNGSIEVGFGHVGNYSNTLHALLWTGAADRFVDLNQYLPTNFSNAVAQGIDAHGNIVGYALDQTANQYEAVLWSPVALTPEPAALIPLAGLLSALVFRRKRSTLKR